MPTTRSTTRKGGAGLRPINGSPLLGTAFTVKVPAGDNLFFHIAMDLAKPGDLIVIGTPSFWSGTRVLLLNLENATGKGGGL